MVDRAAGGVGETKIYRQIQEFYPKFIIHVGYWHGSNLIAIGLGCERATCGLGSLGSRARLSEFVVSIKGASRLMCMGRDEGRAGVEMFHTGREEAIIISEFRTDEFWKANPTGHGQHRKELQTRRAIKKCLGIISPSSTDTSVAALKVSSGSEVQEIETPLIGGVSRTMRGSTRG